jgi:hypothetical protein
MIQHTGFSPSQFKPGMVISRAVKKRRGWGHKRDLLQLNYLLDEISL